jgi:hypothetical protein
LAQNPDHQLNGKALPSPDMSFIGLDSPQTNPQPASEEGYPSLLNVTVLFMKGNERSESPQRSAFCIRSKCLSDMNHRP